MRKIIYKSLSRELVTNLACLRHKLKPKLLQKLVTMMATLDLDFTQSWCSLAISRLLFLTSFSKTESALFEKMACFQRASLALKDILLKLYNAEKAMEIDFHLYEFGDVEYHVQSSPSGAPYTYLSISTPLLSQAMLHSQGLSEYTIGMIKRICPDALQILDPANQGYHLTLRLNFSKIPRRKDSVKVITEISTVQAVILSCQLKEMLKNLNSSDMPHGVYRPIKLVYNPREPFFVIRQAKKITVVFPTRFNDESDVIIATAFFQELMDVGSSEEWAKAPPCTWSPIPPPELRGELLQDLSTNAGFVSFDISSRHIEGKGLDKTVWILLNFHAFVKYHVKCTRGFIQRRMRTRLESLVEVLHKGRVEEDEHVQKVQDTGCGYTRKLVRLSAPRIVRQRYGSLIRKIKRIHCPIKIHGFDRFRRRWLRIPKFSKAMKYSKLE